ncbi:MAG: hypothetical protein QOH14_3450 [Pseudonocardiales bacterium]|jgi:Flp pilus assembly protein TadB|nr:hypothetical protein [Pseudonocardiales bacterium]
MNAALTWLLLAAALALVRVPSVAARSASHAAQVSQRQGRMSPTVQRAVVAVAIGGGCVALLGPVRGALADALVAPVAAWATTRLAARHRPRAPDTELPLTLDLIAAALRGGKPVPDALLLAAPAHGAAPGKDAAPGHGAAPDILGQVAGLLRLGADPAEAWRIAAADPQLADLAHVARRSSTSGIRLAGALELLAVDLRADLRASAEARAQRAGVLAMAPLGLCFLPAFVCLGVTPVIVGIASGMAAAVP